MIHNCLRMLLSLLMLQFCIAAAFGADAAEADDSVLTLDETTAAPEPDGGTDTLFTLDTEPLLKKFVKADYPAVLQKKGAEGTVRLLLQISDSGTVDSAGILDGCHPLLDSCAERAARHLEFSPATAGGETVPVLLEFEYRFTLDEALEHNDTSVNFSGRIFEKGTRLPVPDAIITIEFEDTLSDTLLPVPFSMYLAAIGRYDGQSLDAGKLVTTSDSLGNFAFRALPSCSILVTCIISGYQPFWQREVIFPDKLLSVIYRPERESYSEYEIVVYGKSDEQVVSRRQLSKNEVKKIPGVGGDAVKVVQALPGVGRPTMGNGDVIVRGARPWDSGFFLDGLKLPLLYHFDGIKSTYNAEALEVVDFYPGGTDVRHGGYIGGIVDLVPRKARTDRFHGYGELNLIDASFYVEGPVHKKVSVLVSARRSFAGEVLSKVLDKLEEWGSNLPMWMLPFYWDYLVRTDIAINDRHSVSLSGFGAHDSLSLIYSENRGGSSEIEGAADRMNSSVTFNMLSGNWNWKINESLTNSLRYGCTFNRSNISLFRQLNRKQNEVMHNIHDELTWKLNDRVKIYPGGDILLSPVDLILIRPDGDGNIHRDTTENWLFGTIGAYLFADIAVTEKLSLFPGLRFDYFPELNYNGPVLPEFGPYGDDLPTWRGSGEPSLRIAARYKLRKDHTLKAAIGNYSQTPQPVGWAIHKTWGEPDLPPTRAAHYVAGYLWNITDLLSVDLQCYFNYQWNIPRIDTTESAGSRKWASDVKGRMFGAELMVRYLNGKHFFGWLAYTFSRSQRLFPDNDGWILFDEDIPHYLQLVGGVHLPLGWDAGIRIQWATGKPQTPVTGSTLYENSQTFIPVTGEPLSERTDPYFTLGLRFDKLRVRKFLTYTLFLDIPDLLGTFYSSPEFFIYNYDYTEREAFSMIPLIMGGIKIEF